MDQRKGQAGIMINHSLSEYLHTTPALSLQIRILLEDTHRTYLLGPRRELSRTRSKSTTLPRKGNNAHHGLQRQHQPPWSISCLRIKRIRCMWNRWNGWINNMNDVQDVNCVNYILPFPSLCSLVSKSQ